MGDSSSSRERRAILREQHVLSLNQRLAYSVGHVLNDLCAAMWFSYLLVFMHFVKGFHSTWAGALLLIGQVADAASTPFVGIESDKNHTWWFCRYGRRKTWHLLGTVCVVCSFPFLFNKCISCENSHEQAQVVYYAAFIVVFQFGWAAVQISHLSLIPELSPYSNERVELNALRYAFTVASNIAVYSITWIYLRAEIESDGSADHVGPNDAGQFRNIVFTVVAIGFVFSCIFHVLVDEKQTVIAPTSQDELNAEFVDYSLPHNHLKWKHWFGVSQFYKIGVLYMATRLCINLTQVYIPLYLQDSLHLSKDSIAYIPLVIYCSGFLASFLMKYLNNHVGKKWTYFLGSFVALIAYSLLYFGSGTHYCQYEIYAIAVMIDISGSTMLITSLAITNDLIGHNTSSGAFVFGAMSFLDKMANGIAVIIIENMHPCLTCDNKICESYYRNILTFVCGGSTILALSALAFLAPHKIGASKIIRNPSAICHNDVLCQDDDVVHDEDEDEGIDVNAQSSPLLSHNQRPSINVRN